MFHRRVHLPAVQHRLPCIARDGDSDRYRDRDSDRDGRTRERARESRGRGEVMEEASERQGERRHAGMQYRGGRAGQGSVCPWTGAPSRPSSRHRTSRALSTSPLAVTKPAMCSQ
eukprot:2879879-Rhodomonas_salina.2